jgi:hypothetical protein
MIDLKEFTHALYLQMFFRLSIPLGISPVKKFEYSPIATRLLIVTNSEGMLPMREQSLRKRCVRWLNWLRLFGIVPLK